MIAVFVVKVRSVFHNFVSSSREYVVPISATSAKPQDVVRNVCADKRLKELNQK